MNVRIQYNTIHGTSWMKRILLMTWGISSRGKWVNTDIIGQGCSAYKDRSLPNRSKLLFHYVVLGFEKISTLSLDMFKMIVLTFAPENQGVGLYWAITFYYFYNVRIGAGTIAVCLPSIL